MTKPSNCKAIRCNDEMQCGACGLTWEVNDPEPPACRIVPAPANALAQISDKGLADRIAWELPHEGREVMRRLTVPQPVDQTAEDRIARLTAEVERLRRQVRKLNGGTTV